MRNRKHNNSSKTVFSKLRLDYFHVKRHATVFHFKNNNNLYGSGMRTITIFGR